MIDLCSALVYVLDGQKHGGERNQQNDHEGHGGANNDENSEQQESRVE